MPSELLLDDNEHEILLRILTTSLTDLRFEISHTDSREMRRDLQRDEEMIKRLLERLAAAKAA